MVERFNAGEISFGGGEVDYTHYARSGRIFIDPDPAWQERMYNFQRNSFTRPINPPPTDPLFGFREGELVRLVNRVSQARPGALAHVRERAASRMLPGSENYLPVEWVPGPLVGGQVSGGYDPTHFESACPRRTP
jgi:hypothetical protein